MKCSSKVSTALAQTLYTALQRICEKSGLEKFWNRHPSLFYSLNALFGFFASINGKIEILLLLLCLWLPLWFGNKRGFKRFLWGLCLMSAMFFCGKSVYNLPQLPNEGVAGTLQFNVSSISQSQTHFGYKWIYQGRGKVFVPDDPLNQPTSAKNFPCVVSLPQKKTVQRPLANRSYVIHGVLRSTSRGSYFFVVKNDTPWHPVSGSWSLAEWRHNVKKSIKRYVSKHIKNPRSAEFLSGIVSGDFEDRIMRMEFGKVGLQHIMAISGFHFALIAMMLSMLLRWIGPPKITTIVLVLLLSTYFFMIGGSPSISRAWVMCLIALLGCIAEKASYALNSLGVALLFILLYDPLLCLTLGFQFSVVTTASILLWYPVVKIWAENLSPTRALGLMKRMSLPDQHCYCVISILKEAIALAVAVNLVALPLALYHFGKFPFLGLLYNLFVPFLVSLSMFLFLIASLTLVFLPPLGSALHHVNSLFTHFMLNFIYNIPNNLNYMWRITDFPLPSLLFYLASIFLLGISLNERYKEEALIRKNLAFL